LDHIQVSGRPKAFRRRSPSVLKPPSAVVINGMMMIAATMMRHV
jgi:hypothetical protein